MSTDAVDLLVADHKKVGALLARIEAGEADDLVDTLRDLRTR
jgi:hypothetical protein